MTEDKFLRNTVGAVSPTIIVYDENWGEDLPEWLKTQISLKRFEENARGIEGEKIEEAMDEEAMAYLYTRSLAAPMSDSWMRIYQKVFQGVVSAKIGRENMPVEFQEDIKLNSYDENQLKDLKRWIYKKREEREKERFNGRDKTK